MAWRARMGALNMLPVRRAGTQGTCHPTLQPWGGSFPKLPLSICLNANVRQRRFSDYLHLQSRLRGESIGNMKGETGKQAVNKHIFHVFQGCLSCNLGSNGPRLVRAQEVFDFLFLSV